MCTSHPYESDYTSKYYDQSFSLLEIFHEPTGNKYAFDQFEEGGQIFASPT